MGSPRSKTRAVADQLVYGGCFRNEPIDVETLPLDSVPWTVGVPDIHSVGSVACVIRLSEHLPAAGPSTPRRTSAVPNLEVPEPASLRRMGRPPILKSVCSGGTRGNR